MGGVEVAEQKVLARDKENRNLRQTAGGVVWKKENPGKG